MGVVKNAKRNIIFGVLNKCVVILCPFITRTVIYAVLGEEYLGLNNLFKSVIQVLNLTELGMGSAIVYSLYKPIAENDTELVNALLNFYRKAYHIIGFIILFIGLCLIPFLPYLINGGYPKDTSLVVLYLISLVDTVISYFMFAYLSSLIIVYQRDDVKSVNNLMMVVMLTVCQVVCLYLYKSYLIFALMMPLFTVLNNLRIAYVVHKMFPAYHCAGDVSADLLYDIKKRVGGSFIAKVCQVSRNSLDSICISTFIGLAMTAVYNNYFYIIHAVNKILIVVSEAFTGGIGNHIAIKTKEENYDEFKKLDLIYMLISGWCAAYILCLSQPFMLLWMGQEMMLHITIVILLCIYFYLLKAGDTRTIYVQGAGLWWEHRFRSIVEAVANIILNIVLGKLFGLYGIIAATLITIFLIHFWWGSYITFKYYFGTDKLADYFLRHLKYFVITTIICSVAYVCCTFTHFDNPYMELPKNAIFCTFIPGVLYYMIYGKDSEFIAAVRIIKGA